MSIQLCSKLSNSQGLADNTVIAKVNNDVWDLDRPLEGDCRLQLLKFDDEEAQAVSVFCLVPYISGIMSVHVDIDQLNYHSGNTSDKKKKIAQEV